MSARRKIKLNCLNFGENEIKFSVLLSLLVGIQRTGLYQIVHQLALFSATELSSFGLGIHPLSLRDTTVKSNKIQKNLFKSLKVVVREVGIILACC